jgi:hypothetical protein
MNVPQVAVGPAPGALSSDDAYDAAVEIDWEGGDPSYPCPVCQRTLDLAEAMAATITYAWRDEKMTVFEDYTRHVISPCDHAALWFWRSKEVEE